MSGLRGSRLLSSVAPGPTSSNAENIFPVSRCTQRIRVHHVYTLVCGQPYRSQTERSQKHSQHQQPHPLPLSGRAGWRSANENVCMYVFTRWILPVAGLRHTVCEIAAPESSCPRLLVSGHLSPPLLTGAVGCGCQVSMDCIVCF